MEPGKRKRRPRKSDSKKKERVFSSEILKGSARSGSGFKNEPKKEWKDKKPFPKTNEKTSIESLKKSGDFSAAGGAGSKKPDTGEVRLNKFIASSGICSRRQADEFIAAGLVSVNDITITEMGVKVKPTDIVKYNGERIKAEKKIYVLLNKPKDYVTTLDDPEGRKTVMDLVRDTGRERIFPVGRLDRNTTGILLLTNDGEIASKLTHPKFNQKKIYHVFLDRNMKPEDFKKVADGLNLDDGFIKPDGISFVNPDSKAELGVEVHSGKNRIVRRMFEAVGYNVTKLDRVFFAGLTKKNLPRGKWRFLSEKEVNILKMSKISE
jgi:23S rRNA pseudouridine2605 synthase